MKKRLLSLMLILTMLVGLLPVTATAAVIDLPLPDWYFLYAIFKNVAADIKNVDGSDGRTEYFMTQDEVDGIRAGAQEFEDYLNSLGVIRAHVDVIEIEETITTVDSDWDGPIHLTSEMSAPYLEKMVDLDNYDSVTCIIGVSVKHRYGGVKSGAYDNGTGHTTVNFSSRNGETFVLDPRVYVWSPAYPIHEFLHVMEDLNLQASNRFFDLHEIMSKFYEEEDGEFKEAYTDILLNQAKGTYGTGVDPRTWQYPPHVYRKLTEWSLPEGDTEIGVYAYQWNDRFVKVTIPEGITKIGYGAFGDCYSLKEVSLPSTLKILDEWAFAVCTSLESIYIPAGVTEIRGAAFYQSALKEVYYEGTAAQWKAVKVGDFNDELKNAKIHYSATRKSAEKSPFTDVKTNEYFYQPVQWAVERKITSGTSKTAFSPNSTCTTGQILTFLWRTMGEPAPEQAVSGTEYYAQPLQWAREQGLVSDDQVPDAPCTRADVVTYLWKLAGSPAAAGSAFADVAADADYAQAVAWAVEHGITTGTGETTFSPDKTCTRGQIVTFLYRTFV